MELDRTRTRSPYSLVVLCAAILAMLLAVLAVPVPALAEEPETSLTISPEPDTKRDNPMTVKAVKVSVHYSDKKARSVAASFAFAVCDPRGTVTYRKLSGDDAIAVTSKGRIKVAKGLAKGAYRVRVAVSAAGDEEYAPATRRVTVTVKITAPKTVFIGDSRTYFMYCDVYGPKSEKAVEKGVSVLASSGKQVWVARGGAYYDGNPYGSKAGMGNGGFKATLIKRADQRIGPGDNIVIAMGANDRETNAARYVNLVKKYRKSRANWKATTIVFVSVTPYGRPLERYNDMALAFNSDIEARAKAAGFSYIDIYTPMKGIRKVSYYRNQDSTHYLPKYSKKVYNRIIKSLPK